MIYAPIVHSQCTRVSCFSFFNKIFITYQKKKCLECHTQNNTSQLSRMLWGAPTLRFHNCTLSFKNVSHKTNNTPNRKYSTFSLHASHLLAPKQQPTTAYYMYLFSFGLHIITLEYCLSYITIKKKKALNEVSKIIK